MKRKRGLAVLFVGALLLAACGDDDDSTVDGSGSDDTAAPSGDDDEGRPDYGGGNGDSDGTAEPTGDATVSIASSDELGEYLVDAEGMTLYVFAQDDGTTTACTGGCVEAWPPLIAEDGPSGDDGLEASELGTADGIEPNQVTYHGQLLYYFSGDENPGDVNGTSIPDWFTVSPSGEAIEVSASE